MSDVQILEVYTIVEKYIDAGIKLKPSEIYTLLNYFDHAIKDLHDR